MMTYEYDETTPAEAAAYESDQAEELAAMEAAKDTFTFPAYRLAVFEEKFLAKMNKVAAKLGVEPVTVEVLERFEKPRDMVTILDEAGFPHKAVREFTEWVEWVTVKVTGVSPKLAGWQFAATLDQRAEGVNLLRVSPAFGQELPERFRTTDQRCDHCQKVRNRAEVFVLFNEEKNEFVQVGRQCVKEFLGGTDPAQIAQWLEWLGDMEDAFESSDEEFEGRYGGSPEPRYEALDVLTWAAVATRVYGFASKGAAYNNPSVRSTADRVEVRLSRTDEYLKNRWGVPDGTKSGLLEHEVTEADKALASGVFEYVAGLKGQSDYEYNLKTLFKTLDKVKPKDFGMVCSAVGSYQKFLGLQAQWEIERAQREAQMAGKTAAAFVGEVGGRYAALLKLVATKEFAGDGYGYDGDTGKRTLVTFLDENGNVLKWFTGDLAGTKFDVEPGTTLDLAFTVKKHDEYKGEKQTMLSRVGAPPKKRPPAPQVSLMKGA